MANNIKGITIEIGGNAEKLEKSLNDVYKKGKDLTSEMKNVDKALRFNPKNIELVGQKQKILSEQVETTKKRLDELKIAQEQVNEQFKKGEISEEQYRAFQREIIETESVLKNYEGKLADVTDKHRIFGQKMEEYGKKMQGVGDKMQTVGKKMQDVGKGLTMKVTAPIVAVGTLAIKTGADFERGMSEVQAVSGATAEELELLEESARLVGKTTNKSAREAADALVFLGMAGWDVEDSQAALLPLVKLSTAGNIELGKAADLVTNSMSTMGIEIADVDEYMDVLAKTSTMTNTDIAGLAEAFVVVGGRLNNLGVDFNEGSVALAVLAKNGIAGGEAGTKLNAILANLTAPTGRAKKALEELGVSAFDSNGEFIGIEETLQLVKNATEGMTDEQENMYLSMIGGKEHTDGLSALMNGLEEDFGKFKDGVGDSKGALDEMYDVMTDNLQGGIDGLQSSLSDVAISFYKMAEGPLKTVIEKLTNLVDWFGQLDDSTQQTIVLAAGIAAALGPVVWILGSTITNVGVLVSTGGKLIESFGAIKAAGGMLSGGLTSTIGFLFSPAGAILVGIAAVIAVGVLLYKNWDTVKEKAGQLKEFVSLKWTELSTATSEKFNQMKNDTVTKFNELKDGAVAKGTELKDGVVNKFNEMKTKTITNVREVHAENSKMFNDMKTNAINKSNELKNGMISKFNEMKTGVVNKATEVKNGTINKFNELKSGATTAISNTVSSIRSTFSTVYNAIMSPINRAKTGVQNAISAMKGFFNFSWSLPKIKMPHFSVSGSANPLNWLSQGVPKINVDWYAKGGIFTQPTVLQNGVGLGEYRTGGEAVLPLNRLPQMMADAMDMVRGGNDQTMIVQIFLGEEDVTDLITDRVDSNLQRIKDRKRRGGR